MGDHDLRGHVALDLAQLVGGVEALEDERRGRRLVVVAFAHANGEDAVADADGVAVDDPQCGCDGTAVEQRAVATAEIFDEDLVLASNEAEMAARDRWIVEAKRANDIATDERLAEW